MDTGDFGDAWGGIASVQLGLPAVWTEAARRGIGLDRVAGWMAAAPAALTGLADRGAIRPGLRADLCCFAPDEKFVVDPAALRHRNPVTPYAGRTLTGVVRQTWLAGRRAGTGPPAGQLVRSAGRAAGRQIVSGKPGDFTGLPDLASRALGGTVLYANDEFFADARNLIEPRPAGHDPAAFGIRGKEYDGWETRRRREPGADFVIIRLAAPAIVRGVNIDTAHFRGNYPPSGSVAGATLLGYPSAAEVLGAAWTPLAGQTDLGGDRANLVPVTAPDRLVTHVRLTIHPDGGVARLRVFGEVVPDPRRLGGRVDLAATAAWRAGGGVQQHVLLAARQRAGAGAGPGHVGRLGDRPPPRRRARLAGGAAGGAGRAAPRRDRHHPFRRQRAGPGPAQRRGDRRGTAAADPAGPGHRALVPDPGDPGPTGLVRLDIYPDGGISRLRLVGVVPPERREQIARRWLGLLPADVAAGVDQGEFFD